jgi:chromosome segregation protein
LLDDWLHGAYVADSLEQALGLREQLQAGQVIYVPAGHAVSRHGVSFYAQDSEQAGLLARAKDIENLERQLRAQSLIVEEARSALLRAESAYAQASERLAALRQDSASAQERAHALQVDTLRLQQLADQTRTRAAQLHADLEELDVQLEQLQERRITAEARFEELDMQLADNQERQAQLDDRVMEADRALSQAREQQRDLERQAQEALFELRTLQARMQELSRGIEMADQQSGALRADEDTAQEELERLSDATARSGLQGALALKLERETELGATRSRYDDLTAKLRASAPASRICSSSNKPAVWVLNNTSSCWSRHRPIWRCCKPRPSKAASVRAPCSPKSSACSARSRHWAPSIWPPWRSCRQRVSARAFWMRNRAI